MPAASFDTTSTSQPVGCSGSSTQQGRPALLPAVGRSRDQHAPSQRALQQAAPGPGTQLTATRAGAKRGEAALQQRPRAPPLLLEIDVGLPGWATAPPLAALDEAALLAPTACPVRMTEPRNTEAPRPPPTPDNRSPDFWANVGAAIRTLREDIPRLFQRDLCYDIYREDVVFRDPRNTFRGLRNYRTIFWSLRFHGRLFFQALRVEVQRLWQPSDHVIKMRWTVKGVPRVPWRAMGVFEGVSTFKLDSSGKIYEHQVDNTILSDPPMLANPLFAGLNLIPSSNAQPCPGAWFKRLDPTSLQSLREQVGPQGLGSAAGSVSARGQELYEKLRWQLEQLLPHGLDARLRALQEGAAGHSISQRPLRCG